MIERPQGRGRHIAVAHARRIAQVVEASARGERIR